MLLAVAFAYFYYLVPARERLNVLQTERGDLQRRLRESETGFKRQADAQASVAEIQSSLRNFESNYLTYRRAGRTSFVQELNDLAARNNLLLSSSVTFTGFDADTAIGKTSANGKEPIIFPGLNIAMSVDGAYADLRRFIRDVEASKQFLLINSVELEQAEDQSRIVSEQSANVAGAEGQTTAAAANAPITLHLELTAYFQREPKTAVEGNTGVNQ